MYVGDCHSASGGPVCGVDAVTYASVCHANCVKVKIATKAECPKKSEEQARIACAAAVVCGTLYDGSKHLFESSCAAADAGVTNLSMSLDGCQKSKTIETPKYTPQPIGRNDTHTALNFNNAVAQIVSSVIALLLPVATIFL